MIFDFRKEERKLNDLIGKPTRSLNEDLGIIRSSPYIISCTPRVECNPSLTHSKILEAMVLIVKHPKEKAKTLVQVFDDKKPFEKK